MWWKTLDFASAKLKEVGKFLNFGYRNRSRKENCFLPHGRRNLGSIEYIKYWYQETTAKLLIGADYDFILSWERNMRPSLVSTPHYILKNWLRNFSSQGQMTEWRLGPQHNLLNTATLQTNSVDYLKKTHLSYEGKKLPHHQFVQYVSIHIYEPNLVWSIFEKNDDYSYVTWPSDEVILGQLSKISYSKSFWWHHSFTVSWLMNSKNVS